ncbi:MAG: RecBCD enzyme subunit RecD [Turneriella sp.]|nr:RecBCD enzyme subunit RecD [Turneriella sp.]
MENKKDTWATLVEDNSLWPQSIATAEERTQLLEQITQANIAFETKSDAQSTIFLERTYHRKQYLVPQRHALWLDKLLKKRGDKTGKNQDDAQTLFKEGNHLLLTGGPGTGKSFTISQFIESLKIKNGQYTRVAICAPTGKAAARFISLEKSPNALVTTATIHRLLGVSEHTTYVKYNARNPLPYDIVIVDEVSMLNLFLLSSLVHALPPHAQLVLVGDLQQLPTIDGIAVDKAIHFLVQEKIVHHIHLTEAKRFSENKNNAYKRIAQEGFAALQDKEVASEISTIPLSDRNALYKEIDTFIEKNLLDKVAQKLRDEFSNIIKKENPSDELLQKAFNFLSQNILLCERREGAWGSHAFNAHIRNFLKQKELSRTLEPIINTQNNYTLQLLNGDLGFLYEKDGVVSAYFKQSDGTFRRFLLDELRHTETAYALTIHKSQGSEYNNVFIVCEENGESDPRLLYTAVTRAKDKAVIWKIK